MTVLPEPPCILVCRDCGDGDDANPLEFGSQAERGRWASQHTRETGHDRWIVVGSAERLAAHLAGRKAEAEQAAILAAALAAFWCEPDNCPASICGGPHREVVTDLGTEILRQDQEPIGKPVARPGKDAE
ncbi:MAG TPA: hypothetical protein VIZ43_08545 [Trebonia sp.]